MGPAQASGWGSDEEDEFFDALEDFEDSDISINGVNGLSLASFGRGFGNGTAGVASGRPVASQRGVVFSSHSHLGLATHPVYPLHAAAFNNDLQSLQQLLATLSIDKVLARDVHGNNALHIATFQEHEDAIRLLLASGFSALAKSARGWTPLDEALSVRNQRLALMLARQESKEMKDEIKGKQKLLLQTLLELPDYSLQLKWELGSSVPGLSMLVRKYLPHDTYSIWKKGQLLRVDGTLMGIDSKSSSIIPEWKRGHFSILFDGSGEKSMLYFVNRTKNTYVDVQAEKKKSKEMDNKECGEDAFAEERVRHMMSRTQVERPKLQAGEVKFKPAKGWFGGELAEKVEGWHTKVYDATAKLTRLSRGKTCFRLSGSPTFDDYLAASFDEDPTASVSPFSGLMEDAQSPSAAAAESQPPDNDKPSKGPKRIKISGRCWMAEGFPMSLRQLLPLLDVVGTANKHIAKVAKFMNKYGNLNMFPVRVQVSLWLSVYALLSFRHFMPLKNKDGITEEFFRLPKGAQLVSLQEILEQQAAKMSAFQTEQEKLEAEGIEYDDSDLDLLAMEGAHRDTSR